MEFDNINKRISVNTSLKNARIFDDDSWDAETAGFNVKKEPLDSSKDPEPSTDLLSERRVFGNVKMENEVFEKKPHHSSTIQEKAVFKAGPTEGSSCFQINRKIKIEKEDGVESLREFRLKNQIDVKIKSEPTNDETKEDDIEESYLDKLDKQIKMEIIGTPNKINVMRETSMDDSNPSPFNKELFKHFSLKQDNDDSPENSFQSGRDTRKSVKRTIFTRSSPYKRHLSNSMESSVQRNSDTIPLKDRLGIKDSCDIPNKKPRKQIEKETDPTILARRQKQIDYGLNSIAYDNYIKLIPKHERTREDVKTPDKFVKYSRRAWDGLIKQWRLKLHRYDPKDD